MTYLIYLLFFLPGVFANELTYSDRQPDMEVHAFAQDNEGYIWIATSRGLARFNGTGYLTWSAGSNAGDLPNDKVMSLMYDGQDRMWIGTECGLGFYGKRVLYP